MDILWKYTGMFTWSIIVIWLTLRILLGKNWMVKLSTKVFLGSNLMASTKKLVKEIKQKELNDETVTEFGVHIFWRLTRIGLVGLLIAGVPIWLLMNQNLLLEKQNEKINLQNNLIEADRRSALILLMSNILNEVSEEISQQNDSITNISLTKEYELSPSLIGRISALSRGFFPYRRLTSDTLTTNYESPERGQLLLSIISSRPNESTRRWLFPNSDFSYAYLAGADLSGELLSNIDLSNANLSLADLRSTVLTESKLYEVDFREANLSGANLGFARCYKAIFCGADLSNTSFWHADLEGANFCQSKNLIFEQLLESDCLYNVENLDEELLKQLKEKKPCLFEDPLSPKACKW